jgi:transcription antitermination factor NusG
LFVRGILARKSQILTTPGVHMILHHGEDVAVIPEEQIQAIQKALESSSGVEPHPFLKCGSRVRVTRGPLEGVEGILIRKMYLCRLVLSVEMLAQSVAVEVNVSDVEHCTSQSFSEREFHSSSIYNRHDCLIGAAPLRLSAF